jgi:hypothetical protein
MGKSPNAPGFWPEDPGGGASRFFFRADWSREEIWKEAAAIAENHSKQLGHLVSTAQRLVAIADSQGAKPLSELSALFISDILKTLGASCEIATPATQDIARRFLLGLRLGETSKHSRAQNAEAQKLTDIITTTIAHLMSYSSADPATLSTTPKNSEHGAKVSASRAIYCAKTSTSERNSAGENKHPTVKPQKLMRYLCRLITPPNGVVLDPFLGSGSTGVAARAEGFEFVGIEREAEYVEIAEKRIGP